MKIIKTIAKIFGWVLIALIAIVLLVLVAMQTRPFKNRIVDIAQTEVNKILKAQLHVENLEGNFFNTLRLNGVLLELGKDTIGYIPELKLNYHLLPLLRGNIEVNSVEIETPIFYLTQYADSTWNFSNITQPNENPDTISKPFGFQLNVERIKINNASIRIHALDTIFPRLLSDFYSDLSFKFTQEHQEVNMRELRFNTYAPDVSLKNIKFQAKRDGSVIQLKDFLVETALNNIKCEGIFDSKNLVNSFVNIETAPIRTEEFNFLFPNLKIPVNPKLKVTASINQSFATADVSLREDRINQGINVQILSENLVNYIKKKTNNPLKFILNGNFEQVNVSQWSGNPSMDYKLTGKLHAEGSGTDYKKMRAKLNGDFKNTSLLKRQISKLKLNLDYNSGNMRGEIDGNGSFGSLRLVPDVRNLFGQAPSYTALINAAKLDLSKILLNKNMASNLTFKGEIKGSGFNPKTMTAVFNGNLTNSNLYGYSVNQLDAVLNYHHGNVNGDLQAMGDFGKLTITPDIKHVLNDNPSYTAAVVAEHLNLATLLSNDTLASDLNMRFDVVGQGLNPKNLTARVNLVATPSFVNGINIQQFVARADYKDNNIVLDSLSLNTETISLFADGNYSLTGYSDLVLNANLNSASEISKFLSIDSLETKGIIEVHVFGRVDSLMALAHFQLDSTKYGSYSAGAITGKVDGLLAKNDTLFNADVSVGNVLAAGFTFNSIDLKANSNIRSTDLELNVAGKEINTNVNGNVNIGEDLLVRLDDMLLDYKGSDWKLVESPATIRLGKQAYEIGELMLVSGREGILDSLQIIQANGIIRREGEQNLDIKMFNINIPSALNLFEINQDIEGRANLNLYVRGTAEEPLLDGGFNVDKASFNDYKFKEFAGTINFLDKKLVMDAGIIPQDSGILELTGYIPFDMRMDSLRIVPPAGNDSINLMVSADKIPLKIAGAFFPIDKIEGFLQSDILVNGTMSNPNPVGDLHIVHGKLQIKKYGIDYRKLLAAVNFEKETVTVDTIFIQSKSGTMIADGTLGFNSQFYKGDIQDSELNVKFENFHPLNHKYYNMELDGDVALHGKKDSVYFDGDVNILESLIYLPAVMNLIGANEQPEVSVPVLISELERSNQTPDSVIFNFREDTKETGQVGLGNYFQNIQGKIKVFIPRNTWIKNEQMRFEIAGDMEMIKHRESMELFGTVDVVRGQYELLGKTFVVDEGAITFQGGEEFNPVVDLVAHYNVRAQDRTENKLVLNVTGKLKEPEIKFKFGNEQLTEGDALSYILFGTNIDALASGQQAAIMPTAGSLATGAASSLVSSELTKLLGRTLSLDYIEMKTGSSFENATFTVGKYITNKLFMSYERRFGDFKDEKVAEYEVKLEYELFRYLFLQLAGSPINNGIDVIFKIDSKTNFRE
ncbi:MAG: translocation/assembly module TamB domain-containing protein [Paludibacteraceae bacterium]